MAKLKKTNLQKFRKRVQSHKYLTKFNFIGDIYEDSR